MNPVGRVLIVDDHLQMAETIAEGLVDRGIATRALDSSRQAVRLLEAEPFDVLVTDLRMPDLDGLQLLAASKRLDPERPVIVMTAYGAIETAIEAVRKGAFHYLTKPFRLDELYVFVARALDQLAMKREIVALREAARRHREGRTLIAESAGMREVLDTVERVARAEAPILVLGETGTGKGRIAEELHARSSRASKPFVSINCAAIPESLLESELFGHVKGAFTGASDSRPGLFVEANGGTLFLDEIGDLALGLQAKLLHVLERGAVRPVGSSNEKPVDVRIVAATHRSLRHRVTTGEFREDLLYRLDVVSIELPPLRQRLDDLPMLIEAFLQEAKSKHPDRLAERFSPDVLRVFYDYAWPGNVRELAHVVERCVLLARRPAIGIEDLPPAMNARRTDSEPTFSGEILPLRELKRRYVAWACERFGGDRHAAAESLAIDARTLAGMLHGDDDEADREEP